MGNSTTQPAPTGFDAGLRRRQVADEPVDTVSEPDVSEPDIFLLCHPKEAEGSGEWLPWAIFLILAVVGCAAATYFLVPLLR